MAVQNQLAKQQENKFVEYEVNGEKVKLSPNIIRNYLVSGGGNVSDQEIVMFLNLCRFQHLNPFLREAYLIKYGGNQPATMVTGKEVFTKRARRNKDYAGQQAGVVVQKEDSTLENRIGTLVLENEKLVGGWAKVFIKEYVEPVEITVSLSEYIGTKKDGEVNGQWSKKPATMIRKVALVQALREAFPEDFSGMYSQEEVDTGNQVLDESPIDESKIIDITETEVYRQPQESDPLA
ncbi:MAG: phage recombination protein Bet [Clostridium sp.]|uniref:phage recombination protein Bet n=1 Tax=Clostridium sp. TaxID=1506 RepID=UPI0029096AC4|nr:phage recombination protein Bet [Clostridium sp.]MDU7339344.1 phage recombination protein Bet [Clostridium sp.]